jgi:hypothetical protein
MTLMNMPIGTIIAWGNTSIPSGWFVCDGNNGTPNLVDKFVRGAADDGVLRNTGGNDAHYHENPNSDSVADHNHGGSVSGGLGNGGTIYTTTGSGVTAASSSHTHSISIAIQNGGGHSHTIGNTNSVSHLPRYIKRVFIRRNT